MNMMKKMMIGGAIAVIVAQGAFAQMDKLTQIDIKEIQKIQFVEVGQSLDANTTLLFINNNTEEVVLRNAKFNVGLKVGDQPLPMGLANIAELKIPAATSSTAEDGSTSVTAGTLVQMLPVRVGPKDDATIQRLLAIFNVFGDPSTAYNMTLVGDCDVGFTVPGKGTVIQKGIGVEFKFAPEYKATTLAK